MQPDRIVRIRIGSSYGVNKLLAIRLDGVDPDRMELLDFFLFLENGHGKKRTSKT